MTTVHGHNQIFQQSGIAQDLAQQIQSPKPDPDQAAIQHQNHQVVENTTVQESEETLSLKQEKEKRQEVLKAKRAKKQPSKDNLPPDPDGSGRLLDITV
ncbi:hypothetical protein [Desulfobacter postgatei]|jgi:hypothetical protein|uniref:hypothetical protein n=1 Tax=Desulfobacter postgatei TaxID=2293 RepID=UPI002A36FFDD|nr:hypothetical protein [Desulfobacter postgatei]MDX9964887.1 hypothetical protein [Desulfobacter postgatei]